MITAEKRRELGLKQKQKDKKNAINVAGAGVVAGGISTTKHFHDRGYLTGRETLYHNTDKRNVDNILEKGMESSRAADPNNITNQVLHDVSSEEKANKVYFGRKKSVANGVGQAYMRNEMMGVGAASGGKRRSFKEILQSRKTLKARIPTSQMHEVDNPEIRGAKNHKEFAKILAEKNIMFGVQPEAMQNYQAKAAFNALGRKGTATLEGDIDSNVFVKSKNYKRVNAKEIAQFVKKNPLKFAKGVGGAALGTAIAGAGAKILYENNRKKKASENERDFEKIASYKEEIYERAFLK